MANPRLVVFSRLPAAGASKTRLAKEIGAIKAARCARAMLTALLRELAADARWQTQLAFTPLPARTHARAIAGRASLLPQGQGGLGRRLAEALRASLSPLVIIGSDCPSVRRRHIAAAFRALKYNDAVIGPARDGGFWLIGLRSPPRARLALRQVRWSSDYACADLAAGLAPARIAFLEMLRDIDSREDWEKYKRFPRRESAV